MKFVVKCVVATAVFASPCAWDSDPREALTLTAIAPSAVSKDAPEWINPKTMSGGGENSR